MFLKLAVIVADDAGMEDIMWIVFGLVALGVMVLVFLRFTREGQWLGWFSRTVANYFRTGHWDDF